MKKLLGKELVIEIEIRNCHLINFVNYLTNQHVKKSNLHLNKDILTTYQYMKIK
jgi:hypothetical protein